MRSWTTYLSWSHSSVLKMTLVSTGLLTRLASCMFRRGRGGSTRQDTPQLIRTTRAPKVSWVHLTTCHGTTSQGQDSKLAEAAPRHCSWIRTWVFVHSHACVEAALAGGSACELVRTAIFTLDFLQVFGMGLDWVLLKFRLKLSILFYWPWIHRSPSSSCMIHRFA